MTERTASLNSARSSDQLIARGGHNTRVLVVLGALQTLLGALLAGAGALALLRHAALARAAGGLWAGAAAVLAGVVGVLAGLGGSCTRAGTNSDANGGAAGGGGAVTAHLVMSVVSLGGAQGAAALAAAGLQRDLGRHHQQDSFQEEKLWWWAVVSNALVLSLSLVTGGLSALAAWRARAARRPRPTHYSHNQFEPGKPALEPPPALHDKPMLIDESNGHTVARQLAQHQRNHHKECSGSARSALVSRWLVAPSAAGPRHCQRPVMLVPAAASLNASQLGVYRGRVGVSPRYATLPAPPFAPHPRAHPAHPPPPPMMHPSMYYPVHDNRVLRRRSPRTAVGARRRGPPRGAERVGGSQLTRSLERMHRRRRDPKVDTEAELKRTYTGLDRAYAEQFIAVCDESRHASERHDSLPSDTNS